MKAWPDWKGRTVVCIATGPSLTREQASAAESSGAAILAVNDAGLPGRKPFSVPGCSLWYAADRKFWQHYSSQATQSLTLKVCAERAALRLGIVDLWFDGYLKGRGTHSGLQALQLALLLGASRVLLLGYDCKPRGADTNYFGRKPWPDGAHGSPYDLWPARYRTLSVPPGREVLNCTPGSAIDAFRRSDIGSALAIEEAA